MLKNALLFILSVAVIAVSACKKASTSTACSTNIHGYTMPLAAITAAPGPCSFGLLTESTATLSNQGTFTNTIYPTQATFDKKDQLYFVFEQFEYTTYYGATLYSVDKNGNAKTYNSNDIGHGYKCILYNNVYSKLYCIVSGGYSDSLVEVHLGDSTFSIGAGVPVPLSLNTTAVNPKNGIIYVVSNINGYEYRIYQFNPATSELTVLTSGTTSANLNGLYYNVNDDMLYGIDLLSSFWTFIQINPITGKIKSATLQEQHTIGSYSCTLDPCTNTYLVSIVDFTMPSTSWLYRLNMYGQIVDKQLTPSFYQGLVAE